ncbi:Hypothetical predicted protein [Podarcis lilfordi]|uniref:Uncharacterized protein n=1 Tax=Podarcis lilfordi TaxID=74358 RepID=A0AA35PIT2_9SAUR|nr:Hypothetical predicted protein [Podarcis lilfordi]
MEKRKHAYAQFFGDYCRINNQRVLNLWELSNQSTTAFIFTISIYEYSELYLNVKPSSWGKIDSRIQWELIVMAILLPHSLLLSVTQQRDKESGYLFILLYCT